MTNVILFNGITKLDLPPDRVLEKAARDCEIAVVIGWDKEGQFYFASSVADGGEVLWLIEQAKKRLLETD